MRDRTTTGLIAYGVRKGVLVHVQAVPSGLACECHCVACGTPLIARKGRIRIHHFAHAADRSCSAAVETVLHQLAKEIIGGAERMAIPPYDFQLSRSVRGRRLSNDRLRLTPGGVVKFRAVEIEPRTFKGIVPDVAIYAGTGSTDRMKVLLVEIAVTHRVDRRKERIIRRHGLPAIEVCLESSDACATREELASKLLADPACKRWIFHPSQLKVERSFAQQLRDVRRTTRAIRTRIRDGEARDRRVAPIINTAKREPAMGSMKTFLESERIIASFVASNGRLPSLEESRRLFKKS